MYAVISCTGCKRLRIIDCGTIKSECPFCGTSCEHRYAVKLFEDNNQSAVRDALAHYSGYVPEKKDNREKIESLDPHSTLVYKYEHAGSGDEKLEILSKGLTELYGTFTLDHVKEVDPRNAEKVLAAMHAAGLVAEVRHGIYRG